MFRRRAFHQASVAEIAAAAGYTVGAVYSNFGGKQVGAEIATATEGAGDTPEKLRRGAAAGIAFLDRDPDLYAVFMEFWAVAVRSPELRARNAELWGAVRAELGGLVERHAKSAGERLTLPAEQVGAAIMALGDGLAVQRLEAPDAVPDALLGSLFEALVPALTRKP